MTPITQKQLEIFVATFDANRSKLRGGFYHDALAKRKLASRILAGEEVPEYGPDDWDKATQNVLTGARLRDTALLQDHREEVRSIYGTSWGGLSAAEKRLVMNGYGADALSYFAN